MTVWRQASRYDIPRIAFMNKMDRNNVKLVFPVSVNTIMAYDNPYTASVMLWSQSEVNYRQFPYLFRYLSEDVCVNFSVPVSIRCW